VWVYRRAAAMLVELLPKVQVSVAEEFKPCSVSA
jgi:hypothetical protein